MRVWFAVVVIVVSGLVIWCWGFAVCCGLRVYGFVCLVVWFGCGCSLDGLLCRLFCVTLLCYCVACIVTLLWLLR